MASNDQEVEVKFFLSDLPTLAQRLEEEGAELTAPRVFEVNLRFDTADYTLRTAGQALRLRQDTRSILTFKGPMRREGGAGARQEIEVEVSDLPAARRIFEALGYRVTVSYEKYRTTYSLDDVQVTLDEMPYGSFVELEFAGEGDAAAQIETVADRLGLNWRYRVVDSYLGLFDHVRAVRGLTVRNLTFAEMKDISVTPQDLGLRYADLSD